MYTISLCTGCSGGVSECLQCGGTVVVCRLALCHRGLVWEGQAPRVRDLTNPSTLLQIPGMALV